MDRQLLLYKQEVTYGTDPVAAAINTLRAENVRYTLKGTKVATEVSKPGVGATPSFLYGEHAEVSFEIPLAGSGVAGTAPKWGPLMLSTGWTEDIEADESVTYALRSDPSAANSGAFKWRDAKRTHVMLGCRGRVGFKGAKGQRPMLTYTYKGLYVPVTAGASLVAADANFTGWTEAEPIAQARTTFSLDGVNMALRDISAEAGDNVQFVDLPHQENVALLGERAFTGKLKATTPAIGDFNPETPWRSREILPFILTHGTVAGSVVTVSGQGQVNEPSYSRDEGYDVFEAGFDLMGSDLAASDDLTIVIT